MTFDNTNFARVRRYGPLLHKELEVLVELMRYLKADKAEIEVPVRKMVIRLNGDIVTCSCAPDTPVVIPTGDMMYTAPEIDRYSASNGLIEWYACLDPMPHSVVVQLELVGAHFNTTPDLYIGVEDGVVRAWVGNLLVYEEKLDPERLSDDYRFAIGLPMRGDDL